MTRDNRIQLFDPFQSLRLQIETVQDMFRNIINPCIEIGDRLRSIVGVVDENTAMYEQRSMHQASLLTTAGGPLIIEVNQQVAEDSVNHIVVGEQRLKSIVTSVIRECFPSKSEVDLLTSGSAGSVLQLPASTQWDQVTIRIDEPTVVTLLLDEKEVGHFTDEDLGFHRYGKEQQTLEWRFLLALSVCNLEIGGKGVPTVSEMQRTLKVATSQACQRLKFNLSKKLKTALGLQGDPFYNYREKGFYLPRFSLQSLPELRGNGELFIQGIVPDENREARQVSRRGGKLIP